MLLVYPPKFCITIVSHFSWVLQSPQEKSKTMVMQNFGGQTTCIMAYVRMVNGEHFCQSSSWPFVISWFHCILKPGTDYDLTFCSPQTSSAIKIKDGYYSRGNLVICSAEMFISYEKTVNSRGWKCDSKRLKAPRKGRFFRYIFLLFKHYRLRCFL